MSSKSECPITRAQFAKASKLATDVRNPGEPAERTMSLAPRTFSTGTMGWYGSDKVTVMVDGVAVKCQVQISVFVVGSKELPQAPATTAEAA